MANVKSSVHGNARYVSTIETRNGLNAVIIVRVTEKLCGSLEALNKARSMLLTWNYLLPVKFMEKEGHDWNTTLGEIGVEIDFECVNNLRDLEAFFGHNLDVLSAVLDQYFDELIDCLNEFGLRGC